MLDLALNNASPASRPRFSWRQIRTLTSANLRTRYRNTVAGMIWVVLNPLMTYLAQCYVFKAVLKIQFPNYMLFLLTGLIPWIFLSQSAVMGTTLLTTHARLLKSFPIHPVGLLISVLADNLINFLVTFFLLLVPVLALSENANPLHFLLFPIPLISLFLFTSGLVWFLATLQIFYYDTRFVLDFALLIAFYMSPIFYPADFVGGQYRWLVAYNPVSYVLAPFQELSRPMLSDDFAWLCVRSYLAAFVIFTLAAFFWRRRRNLAYLHL